MSGKIEDVYVAPQLDYKKYNYSYPVYKHSKILPLAGTQTVTVTQAGGQETLFEIPSKVFNLSKSFLSFTMTPQASASFNYVFADVFPSIRQIQLYTRGGIFLADINNFDDYTKAVWKSDIKLEDFLTYDVMDNGSGFGYGLRRNNVVATASALGCRYGVGISTDAADVRRSNGAAPSVSYTEPLYLFVGTNTTADPVLNYKLNLGLIKNSIFALDKDLFFDEVVVVRIVWNSAAKMAFQTNNAANPVVGTPAAYTGTMTMTNTQLFIAIETNQDIVQQIREKKNSSEGISILMPYIYGNKINLSGNSQSISLKYNRAHGLKLLKIYHLPIWGTETIAASYDANNVNGSRIPNFYTLLNNNRLQEFNVDCTKQEDWMLLKDKFAGSLYQTANEYQANWVWIDDFSGSPSPIDENYVPDDDNFIKGLDLSSEQKWDIYLTVTDNTLASLVGTPNTLNHYTFSVTQKMLVVNSGGIQIM